MLSPNDCRLFVDDGLWMSCVDDVHVSIFGIERTEDAVCVVNAACSDGDADSVLEALCHRLDSHALPDKIAERERIQALQEHVVDSFGATAYALTTLFIACHVSVDESVGEVTSCRVCT